MKQVAWETENDPAHAMARDEAAFALAEKGTTVWRFYQWNRPALTIGVFCRLNAVPPIPWTRRITGGGLVLHGHDLTFTVITDDQPSKTAYRRVGQAIVNALNHINIDARLKDETAPKPGTYACFSDPVGGDVVVKGRKLAGYAMRRRRGRILMQGSLALAMPPAELISIVADPEAYCQKSITLAELSPDVTVVVNLVELIAREFSLLFPRTQNFAQLQGLEGKIVQKYLEKYSDPALEPARR
jgi:lipoate-protein ligase A